MLIEVKEEAGNIAQWHELLHGRRDLASLIFSTGKKKKEKKRSGRGVRGIKPKLIIILQEGGRRQGEGRTKIWVYSSWKTFKVGIT